VVAVVLLDALDFFTRAEDERDALVQFLWRDVENALAPGAGEAARLLDDEGNRIGLVKQAQPTLLRRILRIPRIEEHAASGENAVRLGDERGDPSHIEVLAARARTAGEALVDVARHRRFPEAAVRGVDCELARGSREPNLRMSEDELAELRLEGKAVHPPANGQDDHRRRAVDRISSADLLRSRLQEVLGGGVLTWSRSTQNREYAADREVHVDVR
jgi:hypothetical protein